MFIASAPYPRGCAILAEYRELTVHAKFILRDANDGL
jgi:hypothetical protein